MNPRRLSIYTSIGIVIALGGFRLVMGNDTSTADAVKDEAKGIVTFVEGSTKKQKVGTSDWVDATHNTEVTSGERVKTMRRSRVELELAQLDVIRLAPMTTVAINKLYEESQDNVVETDLEIVAGDIWAEVASVDEGATFSIKSAIAGAAIRGTVLRISVNEDNSTELRVYKGEVALTNSVGKKAYEQKGTHKKGPTKIAGPKRIAGPHKVSMEEWVHLIKQMQKIRISPQGKVVYSQQFSDDDADEQESWVQWNRKRSELLKTHDTVPEKNDTTAHPVNRKQK